MCGIVGIISKKNIDIIHDCLSMIAHRGPDDHGTFVIENLALGHHRLAIQDLTPHGHQPMFSNDGNLVMIFNGEIYNHLEIRKEIGDRYQFKSHSDSETILAGFQIFGHSLFCKLNGIFAIAYFDRIKKEITIVRDQFGIKPLYYYYKDQEFYFSSEIKSFLHINDLDRSLELKSIYNYVNYLYSPGENTPFEFVKKIPAGNYCTISLNNVTHPIFKEYYRIPFRGDYDHFSEREWINKIDTIISKAVERQLLSDVPVGFFLSGGLDSSLIVAKAKEITNTQIQCFTIDADFSENNVEGFANDLKYAKVVAKHLDVKLEIVKADINIVEDFDKMIWHLDEPQADAAPLNVYNISQIARKMGHIVLIGGSGGDDVFSGYRRHQALIYEKYFKCTPPFVANMIQNIIGKLSTKNVTIRRLKKITNDLKLSSEQRLAGYYRWLPDKESYELFNNEHKVYLKNDHNSKILLDALQQIPDEKNNLNKMLFWELSYFLKDHNLNYTDKLGMAAGVEIRVPFLDLELINESTRIPPSLKMKGNTTKYILKKVAEKYLPHEVIFRPKTGFGAPVRKWIMNNLDDMIHQYLAPNKLRERGIFDEKAVWSLIQQNKAGRVDASYAIWSLLAIESWIRQFVDMKT